MRTTSAPHVPTGTHGSGGSAIIIVNIVNVVNNINIVNVINNINIVNIINTVNDADARQRRVGAIDIGRRAHEPHGDGLRTRSTTALAGGRSGGGVLTAPAEYSEYRVGVEYALGYQSGRSAGGRNTSEPEYSGYLWSVPLSFSSYVDRSIDRSIDPEIRALCTFLHRC